MALVPNSSFGNYHIGAVIGEGGMGQVYLATDTTLDRKVAIKVLPVSFAQDADRLARFEREAKTLASLNHNNVAQIHGLENRDGVIAIVMELVEGPTLADRIVEGPLAPEEALRIARQIIDGLEAAHDKGIVHRDLKPANIKVTADGLVKILDFGIAKSITATNSSGRHSPMMVTPAVTEAGVIMGTAAYMSPEQARGKFVDQRTDIWAFGCVLYEMLTGQPVFMGEDVMIVMASILRDQSDLASIPATISPAVRHAIKLCLEKDPKKRLHHVGDVRLALAGTFESERVTPTNVLASKRGSLWAAVLGTAIVVLTMVFVASVYLEPVTETPPVRRFVIRIPGSLEMRSPPRISVSPDGRYAVFGASRDGVDSQLWLWSLESLEPTPLQGTVGVEAGYWSPDSQQIAYVQDNSLKRLPINGGPAQTVLSSGVTRGITLAWSTDETILFTHSSSGLARVAASGGEPVLVTTQIQNDGFAHDELPAFLPDGRQFLYFRHTSASDGTGIYQGSLDKEPAAQNYERLVRATDGTAFLPSAQGDAGLIVFGLDNNLYAQPFNMLTGEVAGDAIPLEDGISNPGGGFGQFSSSANGGLLTLNAGSSTGFRSSVFLISETGEKTDLGPVPADIVEVAVSPDGTQVALTINTGSADGSLASEIWIWSRARQNLRLLTTEPGRHIFPRWSQDGNALFYLNTNAGIFRRRADGTGTAELLHDVAPFANFDATADRLLLQTPLGSGNDIFQKSFEPGAAAEVLIATSDNDLAPRLSPDGKWLAYVSNVSGDPEVYVRPYPDVDAGLWLVSSGSGGNPHWGDDGSTLFYLNPMSRKLMRVRFDSDPVFSPGTPEEFLNMTNYLVPADVGATIRYVYDWIAAENSLLVIEPQGRLQDSSQVLMIENRFHELLDSGNR